MVNDQPQPLGKGLKQSTPTPWKGAKTKSLNKKDLVFKKEETANDEDKNRYD